MKLNIIQIREKSSKIAQIWEYKAKVSLIPPNIQFQTLIFDVFKKINQF